MYTYIMSKLISALLVLLLCPLYGFSSKQYSLKELSYDFVLPKYKLEINAQSKSLLQIPGWMQYPNQDGYLLPRSILKIPIPWDCEFENISIRDTSQKIESIQVQLTSAKTFSVLNSEGREQMQFSGNTPEFFTYITTEAENHQKKIMVVASPFAYTKKTQELSIVRFCQIVLSLKKTNTVNSSTRPVLVPDHEKYNYCIILPKAKIPLFIEYKTFMEDRGIRTILYPLEKIYESYNKTNNPENIRSFLKDFYTQHDLETVLFVGSKNTIPMKQFYPTGNKNEEPVLSDLYYAELTSQWDTDPYLGRIEIDLKDFAPELAIGRIPFDSNADVSQYLSRTIQYYQTIDARKKSVLCAGAWVSYKEDEENNNQAMFDIDGGKMVYKKYQTYFPNYEYTGFFEKEGVRFSQVADFGHPLSYENVKDSIWQSHPLIQLLSGHGNYTGIYRRIWSADKNNNGVAETEEISYSQFFDEKSPASNSLYFADSCSTCQPNFSNLGMNTINKSGGGYLGFASEVYFIVSSCGDPCAFESSTSVYSITAVTTKFLNQKLPMGESIRQAIQQYRDLCFVSLNKYVMQYQAKNIYATCYYGDPYLKLSGYPQKTDPYFETQGSGSGSKSAFGIKDVSIAKAMDSYSFQLTSLDSFKGRNFFSMASFDIDKDNTDDLFFKVGFDNNSFQQAFYQGSQFVEVFGHYRIRYDQNQIWIDVPKDLFDGQSFRYSMSLRNSDSNQIDTFTAYYPKGATPPPPPEATIPPKPPLLTKCEFNRDKVDMSWIPSQQGTYTIEGYEVFRKEEGGEYEIISTVPSSQYSYTDIKIKMTEGKTYYYRLRAFDNQKPSNRSSVSNEMMIIVPKSQPPEPTKPPDPPSLVKGTTLEGRVYLEWNPSKQGSYPLGGYEVFRKEEGLEFSAIGVMDAMATGFVDQFVVGGKTYYYRIRSFDNQAPRNYSEFSLPVLVMIPKSDNPPPTVIPPTAPTINRCQNIDSRVYLGWFASVAGTYPLSGYEVFRKEEGMEYSVVSMTNSITITFVDQFVLEGKTYTYKIRAYDNQNPKNFSLFSPETNIFVPKPSNPEPDPPKKILPPSPPLIKGELKLLDRSVELRWSASQVGTFPLSGYELYRSDNGDKAILYATLDSFTNFFKDTKVMDQHIYTYFLMTIDNQSPPHKSLASNLISIQIPERIDPTIKIKLKIGSNLALVGSQFVVLPIAPFTYKDRTMVPMRFISEVFGAKVLWVEDESRNGEGTIDISLLKKDGTQIFITFHTLDPKALYRVFKNGLIVTDTTMLMDVPAFIVKPANRTVVPLRFIAEAFGASITYDEPSEEVTILFSP